MYSLLLSGSRDRQTHAGGDNAVKFEGVLVPTMIQIAGQSSRYALSFAEKYHLRRFVINMRIRSALPNTRFADMA